MRMLWGHEGTIGDTVGLWGCCGGMRMLGMLWGCEDAVELWGCCGV